MIEDGNWRTVRMPRGSMLCLRIDGFALPNLASVLESGWQSGRHVTRFPEYLQRKLSISKEEVEKIIAQFDEQNVLKKNPRTDPFEANVMPPTYDSMH